MNTKSINFIGFLLISQTTQDLAVKLASFLFYLNFKNPCKILKYHVNSISFWDNWASISFAENKLFLVTLKRTKRKKSLQRETSSTSLFQHTLFLRSATNSPTSMRIPCHNECSEWESEKSGEATLFLAVTTMSESARATSSRRELWAFSLPFCSHPDTCQRWVWPGKCRDSTSNSLL